MSDRPKVSFGKVTRGGGKVFVLVKTRGASRLAVSSKGSDGRELPASAIRLSCDEWVAYIAVLDCAQVLTAHALDEDGRTLFARQKTISALGARISSSINTLRKDAVAESIRNADRKFGGSGMRIMLEELLADGEDEILRGTIEYSAHDERVAALPVEVKVLSGLGDDVCLADAALDDVLCTDDAPLGSLQRRLRFSCRIRGGLDLLVVWARLEGAAEWDAFETIEPFGAEALRASTASRYLSAAETDEYASRVALDVLELPARLEQMRTIVSAMPARPTFSVVVPVFNTPLVFLSEMIDSVLAQVYPDFELLLVNASPENGELSLALNEAVARDARVRRLDLEGNLGITENTNAGIRAATGDFVCFLDHDDTIEPDALWWYAHAVCEHPDADLIYCDEDHLLDGRRVGPYFKPDWDPDLLCSENYVCHMLCVRREVLQELGELPRSEFDGSQDHNMTFLVGERARFVCHVPRVLYHWRMHEGSTAGSAGVGQKSYALEAERRAVQAHLERVGIKADAVMERRREMRCDLVYRLPEHTRVSVVIAHESDNPNLFGCVSALVGNTGWQDLEIVVAGELSAEEVARLSDTCGSSHA
ncbi:MAG: glycosyltransferase, partial [Olsenella sp.]|nr:glycosyltransferase [Olsenella sp.]